MSDRIVVMSEGRIEQVGTPFDIYNYPATRFVASFVGTLNIMDAQDRRSGFGPRRHRRAGGGGVARRRPARGPATCGRSRSARRRSCSTAPGGHATAWTGRSRRSPSSARWSASGCASATTRSGSTRSTIPASRRRRGDRRRPSASTATTCCSRAARRQHLRSYPRKRVSSFHDNAVLKAVPLRGDVRTRRRRPSPAPPPPDRSCGRRRAVPPRSAGAGRGPPGGSSARRRPRRAGRASRSMVLPSQPSGPTRRTVSRAVSGIGFRTVTVTRAVSPSARCRRYGQIQPPQPSASKCTSSSPSTVAARWIFSNSSPHQVRRRKKSSSVYIACWWPEMMMSGRHLARRAALSRKLWVKAPFR